MFWQRVGAIRTATADFSLVDLPLLPANVSRNASVRVIRSGLAVQCFNILEDFVKARTSEALVSVSASGVRFSWLPEALQEAATLGTVRAISVQVKRQPRTDRVLYAQTYGSRIASTQTGAMQLADISFFHSGSNVSAEELRDALAAFGVKSPWHQLSGLLSRIGLSALPAENVYATLAMRRHSAAHDPSTVVSENDLVQSIADASSIGLGYDLLLSCATIALSRLGAPVANHMSLVSDHKSIPLRFIRARGSQYCEVKEAGKRSIALDSEWQSLLPAAKARAAANSEALVVLERVPPAVCWYY